MRHLKDCHAFKTRLWGTPWQVNTAELASLQGCLTSELFAIAAEAWGYGETEGAEMQLELDARHGDEGMDINSQDITMLE